MFEIILSLVFSFLFNTTVPNMEIATTTPVFLSSETPVLSAKSHILYDLKSNSILSSNNPNERLPIASLTKIMTAHIILQENQLDELITVPLEATQVGGSTMNLRAGERISLENLMKGLIINSANDAAITLAIHNSGDTETFVNKMNQYALEMSLQDTSFSNPMGFDSPENYSTANDLLKLTLKAIDNQKLKEIAEIKTETVTSVDGRFRHNLINTNKELNNFQQINGLKTGTTQIAGQCLISTTNEESPKISIIIGSSSRFQDTKTMLDWATKNIKYEENYDAN